MPAILKQAWWRRLAALALAATALASVWMLLTADPETVAPDAATPVMIRAAAPPAATTTLGTERTQAASTTITVHDPAGAPIPGTAILPLPAIDPTVAPSARTPIGTTDDAGMVTIAAEALPESRSIWLRRPGFVPHRLVAVEAGSTHHVVLHPAATCRVSVVDEIGVPVADFAVALSRRDPPTVPVCSQPGAVYHAYGGVEVEPASFGRTNRDGLLVFEDLLPGQHFVNANFDCGPFLLAERSEARLAEAPGEVKIVTRGIWAAVVQLVGDDILAAGFDHGPSSSVAWVDRSEDIRAVRHARARLEAQHPDCRILVGPLAPGRDPYVRMAVGGATSGWSTHTIQLAPLPEVARQTVLVRPGGKAPATARVHLVDMVSDAIVDCAGARVNLGWRIDGITTFLEVDVGTEVTIPAGQYDVSGAGELPPGCFPATRRTVAPGASDLVRIPVPCALHRYAIEVRRPDGSAPTQFGLSISWRDSVRSEAAATWRGGRPTASMLTVYEGRHCFLSTAPTHECRIFVKGYEPHPFELRAGRGVVLAGIETFVVTLPNPAD